MGRGRLRAAAFGNGAPPEADRGDGRSLPGRTAGTGWEVAEMLDQERYGGLLDYLQWADRPHGGENPAFVGMLAMLARSDSPQPSFSTVNGSDAVDKLLSGGAPSRRFRVYRRKML